MVQAQKLSFFGLNLATQYEYFSVSQTPGKTSSGNCHFMFIHKTELWRELNNIQQLRISLWALLMAWMIYQRIFVLYFILVMFCYCDKVCFNQVFINQHLCIFSTKMRLLCLLKLVNTFVRNSPDSEISWGWEILLHTTELHSSIFNKSFFCNFTITINDYCRLLFKLC